MSDDAIYDFESLQMSLQTVNKRYYFVNELLRKKVPEQEAVAKQYTFSI